MVNMNIVRADFKPAPAKNKEEGLLLLPFSRGRDRGHKR